MDKSKRKFVVFDKSNGSTVTITGTRLLAKEIKEKEKDIPKIHMLKCTYGDKVVCEVKQPDVKE
jgi:hypothetical protein